MESKLYNKEIEILEDLEMYRNTISKSWHIKEDLENMKQKYLELKSLARENKKLETPIARRGEIINKLESKTESE